MTGDVPAVPEAVLRILEERARALAEPARTFEDTASVALLVLALGAERYGLEVEAVQEVEEGLRPAPVPGAPPAWAGLVNVRGSLHWVLDLRRHLNLPGDAREGGVVVLVRTSGGTVGLLADAVPELRRVPRAELGPPLGEGRGFPGLVRATTSDLVALVDPEALMADPQLVPGEATASSESERERRPV